VTPDTATTTVRAHDVRVGDLLFGQDGVELSVTRIDTDFMGMEGMVAFVEDSDIRWLKLPMPLDAEVQVVRASA
jgi:hypothetical protein